jgi:hypothetical protein
MLVPRSQLSEHFAECQMIQDKLPGSEPLRDTPGTDYEVIRSAKPSQLHLKAYGNGERPYDDVSAWDFGRHCFDVVST